MPAALAIVIGLSITVWSAAGGLVRSARFVLVALFTILVLLPYAMARRRFLGDGAILASPRPRAAVTS